LGVEQGRQVWSNSGFGIKWAAVVGLEAFGGYAIVIVAVPVAPSPIVMLDSSESAKIVRLELLQFYQNLTARLALL
jgi:hypothetical protein